MNERANLQEYLGRRLRPLALIVLVVVSASAPLAYLLMGTQAVKNSSEFAALKVAESVAQRIQERPLLWRYEARKLRRHLEVRQQHVATVELTDAAGNWIDMGRGAPPSTPTLMWSSAAVNIGGEDVAFVWVGSSTADIELRSRWLMALFMLVGCSLAALMYWLPYRSMGSAEREIGALIERLQRSQAALSSLNTNLESEVDRRSTELREALENLGDRERRLREMSSRNAGIDEKERRELARDLHDSAGQTLTAIRINLQLLANAAPPGSVDRRMAESTVQIADATVDEIRRVMERLAPAILDDVGLLEAIERACDEVDNHDDARGGEPDLSSGRVQVHLDFSGPVEELGENKDARGVETACYRIVQEALTNIRRHAQASTVKVLVVVDVDTLTVSIEDDGKGFVEHDVRDKGRRGIVGMRERVELLGGVFELSASPATGTRVFARFPLDAGKGIPSDDGAAAALKVSQPGERGTVER